ncbi:MAG: 2-phosphosulfolactate phosphatase [Bacteroidales bacterium]|nr:2-phosphosulfolactate phosphatase [Bacteroidales bacterium]MCB9000003.1 2-phosphosulfolactate phosphatase [Bacteroidales bacterium]MCB9013267.1 2-phosphosulfolactate phosphatase [Bacteroidales bacterium]
MGKNKIEVCFSPALYPYFENPEAIVVVSDILRASSAICTAFINGADRIIPVGTIEEAREFKSRGYMVAAERDGIVKDFADFGNSPFNFTPERVNNKHIVYSTTNGTQAVQLASSGYKVIIGAFLNLQALCDYAISESRDIIVLCAGWKHKFNLEDTLFAGAMTDLLIESGKFETICDSALASRDLWNLARHDLIGYVDKSAQRNRLKKNGLDDVIEYCLSLDLSRIIPVLEKDYLVKLSGFE